MATQKPDGSWDISDEEARQINEISEAESQQRHDQYVRNNMDDPLDLVFRSIVHNHTRSDGCGVNCPMYLKFNHDKTHVTGCGPGCVSWFYLSPQVEEATFLSEPPEEQTREVVRWADEAMFVAKPLTPDTDGQLRPEVTIIHMTADPLRVMAAAAQMYEGDPVYSPNDIPRRLAEEWLRKTLAHNYPAPLEFVDIHFMIRNVTRAFTHQMVRQRQAVYIQESLRFAVKENAAMEVVMPPSISHLSIDDPRRVEWEKAVREIGDSYNALINTGIPAEDARGLLPTNIGTSLHYKTNLRMLREHSGNRLCSQAQHEWKLVWGEFIKAILSYGPASQRWQQKLIASMFKPICYQTGKCEYPLPMGRYCAIRDMVDAHHYAGDTPESWTDINPLVLLHPEVARRAQ